MKAGKYFDRLRGVPICAEDGVAFEDWDDESEALFARLQSRIFIFVQKSRLAALDKYDSGVFQLITDPDSAFHNLRIETTLRLLSQAQEQKRVATLLDFGCGPGTFLESVERNFPGIELTGLDISLTAILRAAERVPSAEFVLDDTEHPSFKPGYFDVILLNNVLEHVPAPMTVLASIERMLAPEGFVIVSTPSRYRYENMFRAIIGKPIRMNSEDHVTEYSVGQVIDLLWGSGFEISKVVGPKRKPSRWTGKNWISYFVIKPFLYTWLALVRSHHVLDTTAFYLAQKKVAL